MRQQPELPTRGLERRRPLGEVGGLQLKGHGDVELDVDGGEGADHGGRIGPKGAASGREEVRFGSNGEGGGVDGGGEERIACVGGRGAYRAKQQLELVHGDLCGPVTPATPGGNRYFLLLVDDATRFMWAVLLPSKDAAAEAIKRVRVAAEAESGHKIKVLRTDNGGEFTVAEFTAYCAEEGIKRHFSAPHSPQQNGVVECRNQSVVAMARALLKQRRLPARFWGEAVMMAVHILNRSPTRALQGITPYEAWHGRSPTLGHLKVFRCVAYTRRLSQLRKLDDRGEAGVFIGYAEGAKAYRVYDPVSQRVRISRDVMFDEGRGWDWASSTAGTSEEAGSEFSVEYRVRRGARLGLGIINSRYVGGGRQ